MKAAHTLLKIAAVLTVLLAFLVMASVLSAAGPGAKGAPSLQAYFAKDFTDQAYQQKAFQKVASAWRSPAKAPATGQKAVVIATLLRDGTLGNLLLHMKSGEPAWDEAAMAAVKAASPLAPLPASYRNPSTEVHFHFEWAAAPPKP